jgi:hypothetical protein
VSTPYFRLDITPYYGYTYGMVKAETPLATPYSVKLYEGQFIRLTAIKRQTGVPVPEQIRRAVEAWLRLQEKKR